MKAMKISYDPKVDALSITFRETTVTTKHLAEGIAADYDSEGRLAGLEILDAQKRFGGSETSATSSWKASAHDVTQQSTPQLPAYPNSREIATARTTTASRCAKS